MCTYIYIKKILTFVFTSWVKFELKGSSHNFYTNAHTHTRTYTHTHTHTHTHFSLSLSLSLYGDQGSRYILCVLAACGWGRRIDTNV